MAAAMVVQLIIGIIIVYMTSFFNKEPYHTSILSGHARACQRTSQPDQNELGMKKDLFHALVQEL
ncbi:hypothetical protein BDR04DRAFT_623883 [Suillus decipiens]|nr:hypothetical protein BDR04DRAFT_623883 [Suillus decipiens]